ncbi:hypothetical protein KBI23_06985 [bacterium]|nr:hypothetical protein [bacterium]
MTINRTISAASAFGVVVVGATLFCAAPAFAETTSVDSIENSFPGNTSNPESSPSSSLVPAYAPTSPRTTRIAPLSSPLSGSVRVIDQLNKPTRLKRADWASSTADHPGQSLGQSVGQRLDESAGLADSGLQALFPSKDSFNPPPSLAGFAGTESARTETEFAGSGSASTDQVKPKKKHAYIWNMSLAGGYYDVTNTFQGVVPGDKLYLYGGYMADGHTPVPTGPRPINHGGHIRWSPIMGAPPAD